MILMLIYFLDSEAYFRGKMPQVLQTLKNGLRKKVFRNPRSDSASKTGWMASSKKATALHSLVAIPTFTKIGMKQTFL